MNSLSPQTLYNIYGDVTVDGFKMKMPESSREFIAYVQETERIWKQRHLPFQSANVQAMAIIWVRLPVQYYKFGNSLLNLAFTIHHAKAQYLLFYKMAQKLPLNAISPVPNYATHIIRVECLVVDNLNTIGHVLMVKEAVGRGQQFFKLITGGVKTGETLEEGAIREVYEETGVVPIFKGILGLISRQRIRFGCDEIIIACLMTGETVQTPHVRSSEIREVSWISHKDALLYGNKTACRWIANVKDHVLLKKRVDDFRGPPHVMDWFVIDDINTEKDISMLQ